MHVDPDWASINLGALVCLDCSGVHRHLGVNISKVRSLTLDHLEPELLAVRTHLYCSNGLKYMKEVGNARSNSVFESSVHEAYQRPNIESSRFVVPTNAF